MFRKTNENASLDRPGMIRLAKRVFFTAIVLVVFCLLAEIGVRQLPSSAAMQIHTRNIENDFSRSFNTDDVYVMWKAKPNFHDVVHWNSESPQADNTVTTNSVGFRSPEYPTQKPPQTFRLLCLGDSTTFGWGVDDRDTYPHVLEGRLNKEIRRGTRYEVINAGVTGYTICQGYFLYEKYGAPFSPDIVTAWFGQNDRKENYHFTDRDILERKAYQATRNLRASVFHHSRAYLLFRASLLALKDSLSRRNVPRVPFDDVDYFVKKLQAQCAAIGARLILITPPPAKVDDSFSRRYALVVRDAAARYDADVLELDWTTDNWCHPDKVGHGMVADSLIRFLMVSPHLR